MSAGWALSWQEPWGHVCHSEWPVWRDVCVWFVHSPDGFVGWEWGFFRGMVSSLPEAPSRSQIKWSLPETNYDAPSLFYRHFSPAVHMALAFISCSSCSVSSFTLRGMLWGGHSCQRHFPYWESSYRELEWSLRYLLTGKLGFQPRPSNCCSRLLETDLSAHKPADHL